MARKREEQRSGEERRRTPRVARRPIKQEDDTTQLLERGQGPGPDEVIDPSVESPGEITSEGGPRSDAAERFMPRSGQDQVDNRGTRGTGGEGGYSTLGGGVYPDEGSEDDAPSYGDWQRHSTGAGSGARGNEGLGNPGEDTWGEAQFRAERREEQGRRQTNSGPRGRRRPDEALAQEIREILISDPELEATDIEVEVEGGAVTLRGMVIDSDARLLAEELVESLPGVREIHNRLQTGEGS